MKLPKVAAFVLSLGVVCVSAQITNSTDPKNPGDAICTTQVCNATATDILANMNPSADPCQDFYEFSCGGFMQAKTIPPGESAISTWQFERNNNVTRDILEADPSTLKGMDGQPLDATALRNLHKVQSFYQSCMNETQLAAVGAKPLTDELEHLVTTLFPVPGSPLAAVFATNGTSSSDDSTTSPTQQIDRQALNSALAHFLETGVVSMFTLIVSEDALEPDAHTVMINEAGPTLPGVEMYQDANIIKLLERAAQQMFFLVLGPHGVTNATAGQLAQDATAFEAQLANISTPKVELGSVLKIWNPRTVEQLEQLNGAVDWRGLLDMTLGTSNNGSHPYASSATGSNRTLVVTSPTYQEKLGRLLNQTQPSTLQTYFALKTMKARHSSLAQPFRAPIDELQAPIMGTDPSRVPDRWKTCLSETNGDLGQLLGHFYVAQHFTAEDKTAMLEIIDAMKQTYLTDMPSTTWLDNQTRASAITKLQAMTPLVGYSMADPNVGDSAALEAYFEGVVVQEGDFYSTATGAWTQTMHRNWGKINKKVERNWMMAYPQLMNAFYYPTKNQVLFPAAIMQKPLYTRGSPEYLNYGAIGVVAAHEMTHGFDSNGRLYDATGKLQNWWSNTTAEQFVAKAQCFVDQYSNFTITNPKTNKTSGVNGQLTLGENIADNGGLRKAYKAWYQRFKGGSSAMTTTTNNNQILPGLEKYTRDQLFFISYGQVWCSKSTPEMAEVLLILDTHAPYKWRVNGPVQNTPAFAQAFKCAEGSPMNPAKKCAVWQ